MQANGVDSLAFLEPIIRLTVWLALLAAVFVPLERIFAVHPRKVFRKGIAVDLAYYFISSLLPALLLGAPLALLAWIARQYVPAVVLNTTASLPFWGRSLLGLVASEIGYYWAHRLSHQIPFLWRFHAIHHSAEELDFLVNTRAHPLDMVWGRLCAMTPLYILGLGSPTGAAGSAVPVAVTLITTMWGFFVHANVRWRFGPLEWLIATPGFHHWHHTKTGPLNRNYASTLPWLDWLFGSFHLPRGEWPSDYGVRSRIPDDLMGQFFYPFEGPPPTAVRGPKHIEPSSRSTEAGNDETAVEIGDPSSTA
ncbi:sterol desaturase family protein [Paludisphaera rhizosphaerae]|uniref:sterol desaturase family protein n=1 Tax=Paludisphaera rhizosphaerae TaxID=2711216 RepID=UPI0013EE3670|nr:sterol desaturase family protein [Paludisphaera rhizosphaerae]